MSQHARLVNTLRELVGKARPINGYWSRGKWFNINLRADKLEELRALLEEIAPTQKAGG